MSDIVKILPTMRNFRAGRGVSPEQIKRAEQTLNVTFADEYREYLTAFGVASTSGFDLTGLGVSHKQNVVWITKDERRLNKGVPEDLYVIEQTNMDNIVYWQSRTGEIWESTPWDELKCVCKSLCEYLTEEDEIEE